MAKQKSLKRIPVTEERWKQLGEMKQAGETYDKLLKEMIKEYNRHKLAEKARKARKEKGEWIKLKE